MTSYDDGFVDGKETLPLRLVKFIAPLQATSTPVTTQPDQPPGPR